MTLSMIQESLPRSMMLKLRLMLYGISLLLLKPIGLWVFVLMGLCGQECAGISVSWTHEFPFEGDRPLYIGSRPLGMGNAFTGVADGAEAGFWNPAGLIQWQGVRIFASTKAYDRKRYAFDSKCVAYSYRDIAFSWGNKIALRTKSGDTPDFNYYSFAYKLDSYIAIGGSVKFRRKHPCGYYQFFGCNPGYDLGILWKPNTRCSGGLLLQNMSEGRRWISASSFGLGYELSRSLLLSADAGVLFGDSLMLEPHAGCEWWVANWIAVRVGVSDGCPTAGLGLRLFRVQIDYAWIFDRPTDNGLEKQGRYSYDRGASHFLSGQLEL